MHKYTEFHIALKDKGFSQTLHLGDWVYLPDKEDYMRIEKDDIIPTNYIRAPKLTTMIGELDKYNYTLQHKRIDKDNEVWILDSEGVHIEDENINIALIKFWLNKRE